MSTPADLKPLLRGHYTTPQAMLEALGRNHALVTTLVGRLVGAAERDERVSDVVVNLAARAERGQGLRCDVPEAKLAAWFARCVANSLRDVLRAQRRYAARFEDVEPDPGAAPAPDEDVKSDGIERHPIWDLLDDEACPPNYRLTLKAGYVPRRMTRRDVEVLAERSQRGKVDNESGLVRPVERAWPLLRQIAVRWPSGVALPVRRFRRFAFTVRSIEQSFSVWSADPKSETDRATVVTWHLRARKWMAKELKKR